MSEWIEWHGIANQPDLEPDTLVEYALKTGYEGEMTVGFLNWGWVGDDTIIRYRPLTPDRGDPI